MIEVAQELERVGCECVSGFAMSRYTSMRVGGAADVVAYPENQGQFVRVLDILRRMKVRALVLGAGSNTIIDDRGLEGVVVSTKRIRGIEIGVDGRVAAEAGAMLGAILNRAMRLGFGGFEFAAGIPGTVGGGIFMNAGANGGEIKDALDAVWLWHEGREIILERGEIKFEYRKSHLPKGCAVTRAEFTLRPENGAQVGRRVKEYLDKRGKTQPITMSNSGSIFKNPDEIPAGKLIEELGLKGFSVGGAKFSELHGNFIVNASNARASDVIALIETAKAEALARRGVRLETEVKIIGKEAL
ncbi:MAG: UDP-N-acetylmuramate dehydrogenase [Deltaproteobacteria bacterium]